MLLFFLYIGSACLHSKYWPVTYNVPTLTSPAYTRGRSGAAVQWPSAAGCSGAHQLEQIHTNRWQRHMLHPHGCCRTCHHAFSYMPGCRPIPGACNPRGLCTPLAMAFPPQGHTAGLPLPPPNGQLLLASQWCGITPASMQTPNSDHPRCCRQSAHIRWHCHTVCTTAAAIPAIQLRRETRLAARTFCARQVHILAAQ
jgi:hypothetical protein